MAPLLHSGNGEISHQRELIIPDAPKVKLPKNEIIYTNLLTFGYGHLAAIYGLYLCVTSAAWATIFFGKFISFI